MDFKQDEASITTNKPLYDNDINSENEISNLTNKLDNLEIILQELLQLQTENHSFIESINAVCNDIKELYMILHKDELIFNIESLEQDINLQQEQRIEDLIAKIMAIFTKTIDFSSSDLISFNSLDSAKDSLDINFFLILFGNFDETWNSESFLEYISQMIDCFPKTIPNIINLMRVLDENGLEEYIYRFTLNDIEKYYESEGNIAVFFPYIQWTRFVFLENMFWDLIQDYECNPRYLAEIADYIIALHYEEIEISSITAQFVDQFPTIIENIWYSENTIKDKFIDIAIYFYYLFEENDLTNEILNKVWDIIVENDIVDENVLCKYYEILEVDK